MSSLLPFPPWRGVLLIAFLALTARVLLGFHVARNLNPNLVVHDNPSLPYAEAVEVVPDADYFHTWGVTANPRMRYMAANPPPPDQADRGDPERYGDTRAQAHGILQQLVMDLNEVGLSLRDVANVRAYLVVDPTGTEADLPTPQEAFAAWNEVFTQYFGSWDNPHKPARTSVGITRLFHSAYRLEVEFTCVFPAERGPLEDGTRHHELYSRLGRAETSDRWASFGRPAWPMSTGKAVAGGTDRFFSAVLRPAAQNPALPPAAQNFGNTTQQAESIFKQMDAQLKEAGLRYEDVFFMRTIVSPDPKQSIGRSFGDFNKVYNRFLNNDKNPNRPTRTIMSTPGFAFRKQFLAIEYYAAYPEAAAVEPGAVHAIGSAPGAFDGKPLAGAGVAVPGDLRNLWVSGALGPDPKAPIELQATGALAEVQRRLQRAGMDLDDIVQLRAYIVAGTPDETTARVQAWESLFRQTFGTAERPHRPALTSLPVLALPSGALIELEVMASAP